MPDPNVAALANSMDQQGIRNAVPRFQGRTAAKITADRAQKAQRDQMAAGQLASARQVWQTGTAGDKAALMKQPSFTNQLVNNPQLAKEFGFSDAQDVRGTINGLFQGNLGGNLYDASGPAFERLGGTAGQYQAPGAAAASTLPGTLSSVNSNPPTYPLPGATPGQVPGTSWPSNNMGPNGPQQYFPPPNPNYLSSNTPQGAATYQPTTPGGGKFGGGRGKFG